MSQPATIMGILKQRNAQLYFIPMALSLTAVIVRVSGLAYFINKVLGKTEAIPYIGYVITMNLAAGAIFGTVGGLLLSRFESRRALQFVSVLSILQSVALAYITRHGENTPQADKMTAVWAVIIVSGIGSIPYAIDGICRNVLVKHALKDANDHGLGTNIFTSLYNFGLILSTPIVVALVPLVGFGGLFLVIALTSIFLMVTLHAMDLSHLKAIPEWDGFRKEISAGLRYTFNNAGIRLCIGLSTVITIFGFAYNVLMVTISSTMFSGTHNAFALLGLASGAGCALGTVIALRYGETHRKRCVIGCCLTGGIAQILMAMTQNIYVGEILMCCTGLGFMGSFMPLRGALATLIDNQHRTSFVIGVTFQSFFLGMSVSSTASSALAKHFGCPTVLVICGLGLTLTGIITPILSGIEKIDKAPAKKPA